MYNKNYLIPHELYLQSLFYLLKLQLWRSLLRP